MIKLFKKLFSKEKKTVLPLKTRIQFSSHTGTTLYKPSTEDVFFEKGDSLLVTPESVLIYDTEDEHYIYFRVVNPRIATGKDVAGGAIVCFDIDFFKHLKYKIV